MGDPSANMVICYQPFGTSAILSFPFKIMGCERESEEKDGEKNPLPLVKGGFWSCNQEIET